MRSYIRTHLDSYQPKLRSGRYPKPLGNPAGLFAGQRPVLTMNSNFIFSSE